MKNSNKNPIKILSFVAVLIIITAIVSIVSIVISSLLLINTKVPDFLATLPVIDFRFEEEMNGSGLFHLLKITLNLLMIAGLIKILLRKKGGIFLFATSLVVLIFIPFLFLRELSFYYLLIRQLLISLYYFPALIIILAYHKRNITRKSHTESQNLNKSGNQ
jgi:hypothetical protein